MTKTKTRGLIHLMIYLVITLIIILTSMLSVIALPLASIFNVSLGILIVIITIYPYILRQYPNRNTLFDLALLLSSYPIIKVLRLGIPVIKVWHLFYVVRASNAIVATGNVEAAGKVFDNYISSPALPILIAETSYITGLNAINIVTYLDIILFILLFVPSVYIQLTKLSESKNTITWYLPVVSIMCLDLYSILPMFLEYNSVSLFLAFILLAYIMRRKPDSRMVFVIASLILATMLYYYPSNLFYIVTLLIILRLTTESPDSKTTIKGISILVFSMFLAYTAYLSYMFIDDLYSFITIFTRFFELQPRIVYTEERLTTMDVVSRLLIYISRLSYLTEVLLFIGALYLIAYKEKPYSFLGTYTILLVLASVAGLFVHAFTDYTRRFSIILSLVSTPVLYMLFKHVEKNIKEMLKYTNTRNIITSKISIKVILALLIVLLIVLSYLGTVVSMFRGFMVLMNPNSASDPDYVSVHSLILAEYIGTRAVPGLYSIYGIYASGYLASIYGIDVLPYCSFINADSFILLLSRYVTQSPDRSCSPMNLITFTSFLESGDLLYNDETMFMILIRSRVNV